jgi:hypothetical protein
VADRFVAGDATLAGEGRAGLEMDLGHGCTPDEEQESITDYNFKFKPPYKSL